jgi:hypothetical protein
MSQTIKAHLPSLQRAPQPPEDPCLNAGSKARRRLCRQEYFNIRYRLVLERNVGLQCEDCDHNPGYNTIDLDDIPEEFFIGKGECAYLPNADLRDYDLPHLNFEGANMRKVNLNGTDLMGSNFYEADLRGADLRGSDLRNTNLIETNLNGALFNKDTKFPWAANKGKAKSRQMICEGNPNWCMAQ